MVKQFSLISMKNKELGSMIFRRRIKIKKRFEIEGRSKARLALADARYNGGPAYLRLIEGLRSGIAIKIMISGLDQESGYSFLDRLRKERSADLKLYGDRMLTPSSALSRQIKVIEDLQARIRGTGSTLKMIRYELVISRDHPAELNSSHLAITKMLKFMGLTFISLSTGKNMLRQIFTMAAHPRSKIYPMDSRSLSEILPLYFNAAAGSSGIMVGIDEVSNSIFWLDIFNSPSFNTLVIGETGSGKSFFVKMALLRLLYSVRDTEFYVFDPLKEYKDLARIALEERFSERNNSFQIIDFPGENSGTPLLDVMERIYSLMTGKPDKRKVFVIEESHMILSDQIASRVLENLVRHSRHYSSAIINISQNVDDFTTSRNSSIALNSYNVFLFRTRKLLEKDRKPLKLDGFDEVFPESLLGGKNLPYSECYYANGEICVKLRMIPTREEKSIG
ncbi:MAG: type IV secretory system conjugative DNA transfer family protein [Thermoplasmataceae archaeon]